MFLVIYYILCRVYKLVLLITVSLNVIVGSKQADDCHETALYANDQRLNQTRSVWMPITIAFFLFTAVRFLLSAFEISLG